MRAVIQRVTSAKVSVDGQVVGQCGQGMLVLVAAHVDDTGSNAERLASKLATLRIFGDAEGKMNLALGDLDVTERAQMLAISNFTLYADVSGQRRPSFLQAAPYERGEALFEQLISSIRKLGISVETGTFGAHMAIELINDGPVTLVIDI